MPSLSCLPLASSVLRISKSVVVTFAAAVVAVVVAGAVAAAIVVGVVVAE